MHCQLGTPYPSKPELAIGHVTVRGLPQDRLFVAGAPIINMPVAPVSPIHIHESWVNGMDAFQAIHYNVALLREQQVDEGKQAVHIDTLSSPPTDGISVNNHHIPYWQIALFF